MTDDTGAKKGAMGEMTYRQTDKSGSAGVPYPREWWLRLDIPVVYQPCTFDEIYDSDPSPVKAIHVIEKAYADLIKSRLQYVKDFLKDCIDEIECRGDEDCDHCVVKAMLEDEE